MKYTTSSHLRVGIVGLQPGQSWANRAHLPVGARVMPDAAIRALPLEGPATDAQPAIQ